MGACSFRLHLCLYEECHPALASRMLSPVSQVLASSTASPSLQGRVDLAFLYHRIDMDYEMLIGPDGLVGIFVETACRCHHSHDPDGGFLVV